MSDKSMLKVGEIQVEEGMIDDIRDEWVSDADHLEREMKRGGYGCDGGEEKYNDDMADLCKLQVTAAVLGDYLELRAELARVQEERDKFKGLAERWRHMWENGYSPLMLAEYSMQCREALDPPRPSITEPADRVTSVIREQSTSRPLRDIIAEKIQP